MLLVFDTEKMTSEDIFNELCNLFKDKDNSNAKVEIQDYELGKFSDNGEPIC